MSAETLARSYDVVIDNSQASKALVLGMVVLAEGEGVPAVQPTKVGVEAVFGSADAHSGSCFRLHAQEIAGEGEAG